MMTDLVANTLTVIRNGLLAKKDAVTVKSSKMILDILKILKDQKFIKEFKVIEDNKQNEVKIYLNYSDRDIPSIQGLKRISKPGLRIYKGYQELPRVQNGIGLAIVSTSKGVMTDTEAREQKVGGEIICYAW